MPDTCPLPPRRRPRGLAALMTAAVLFVACGQEDAPPAPPTTSGAPPGPAVPDEATPAREDPAGPTVEETALPPDPDALDMPTVLQKLASPDVDDRELAIYRLHLDFPDAAFETWREQLLPALTAGLADPSAEVRRGALRGLARVGAWAPPLLTAVADRLADEEIPVRAQAADTLGRAGAAAAPVAERLVAALDDGAAVVRHNAAHALAEVGTLPPAAVTPLRTRLRTDEDDEVRVQAALTLGELGARDPSVAKALLEALDDPHSEVRAAAAWALGALRLAAAEARPLLEALLRDDNPEVRAAARKALERLR